MDRRMDYLRKLNDDLISQFKDQPNTKVLMSAIARQFQDLYKAQEQLRTMRWLSNAVGKQLDGIGDIVVMSRADAARLELGKPDASEIDDTTYRKYLYYKIFLNTSTGTRKEIMKALRFFWDEAPLYYAEEIKYPATIFVSTPELSPDVPIEKLLEAPIVKPGGVRFIVRIYTKTNNDQYNIRVVGLSVVKKTKTEMPEAEHMADVAQFDLRIIGSAGVKRTTTQVSEALQPAVSKPLRTIYAPQWSITRTETGDYTAIAGNAQRYKGLSTVKITNTPLEAYGGD